MLALIGAVPLTSRTTDPRAVAYGRGDEPT